MNPSVSGPPADTTCPRCGSFAALHRWGSRSLCAECIERVRHPVESTPLTAGHLIVGVLQLLGPIAPKALVAVLLVELPLVALTLVGDPTGLIANLYGLAALVGTGAVIHLALCAAEGEQGTVRQALRSALRRWIGMLGAAIVSGLIVFFFTLLLVVPGILRALSYALVMPLIVSGEASGVDALEMSRRRMAGHRAQALLAYCVVWIAPVLLFGTYWLVDRMLTDRYGLWTDEVPLPLRILDAVYTLLYPIAELPVVLLSVALHLKLRNAGPPVRGGPTEESSHANGAAPGPVTLPADT